MPHPLISGSMTGVLIASLLAGCATTGGDPSIHTARTKFQSRNTYAQGIAGGAVLGAAAGALIGGLIAVNQHRNFAQGALSGAAIGGAGGGLAGGIYANRVVNQRRAYLAREQALDAAIQNASSTRIAAAQFNRTLRARLRHARSNADHCAGSVADGNVVLESLEREIHRQHKTLALATAANSSRLERQQLEGEIHGLESEKRQLESNIERLRDSVVRPELAEAR